MKLIVTIPALNEEATIAEVIREVPRAIEGIDRVEVLVLDDGSTDGTVAVSLAAGADYVVSNSRNRGLAFTFQRALEEAVALGADVIVNTDADNHYDQTRIPELIQPILAGQADIVVGSRVLKDLRMKAANKHGNRIANFLLQRLLKIDGIDVSSGYRAYSRRAALGLNVFSGHTYTHETLFSALDRGMKVVNVPLPARAVERPSRLISSLPRHVWRAGTVVLQSILRYRPLQAYGALGMALFVAGLVPFSRFLYLVATGSAEGHVQSLVIGAALLLFGSQVFVMGLLATAVGWNRRLLEDLLLRVKEGQLAPDDGTETGTPESERALAPVLPLRRRAAERVKVA
jgi:glycosyltransferase involved in cell wall biosynthesis